MQTLEQLLHWNGFDPKRHQLWKEKMRRGEIGINQNRWAGEVTIEDAESQDVLDYEHDAESACRLLGEAALVQGEVAVMTLAGGVGSRWSRGSGSVKALYAFHELGGRPRSFLEVHLAKSQRVASQYGMAMPHVIATSYLTHSPIRRHLERQEVFGYEGPVALSRGKSVGLRMVPTVHDLLEWLERCDRHHTQGASPQLPSDHRDRWIAWVREKGEATDYTDNAPLQCLHPLGHWFELAHLLINGTLQLMLTIRPQLRDIMLHNIDTLGAVVDPDLLGLHRQSGNTLTFEVVPRCPGDRGGSLVRAGGQLRLMESMALPESLDEHRLSFYNSMTTWVNIDRLLQAFGLTRHELHDSARVGDAVRQLSDRMPTYVTIKQVCRRGIEGEPVLPVAQCEKLWSDMTALPELDCQFVAVPRHRGQQFKDPAQLDAWLADGAAEHIESLCHWQA